jgi:hypothetical protein
LLSLFPDVLALPGAGVRAGGVGARGRWALKYINQACMLHRDDQAEHE